MKDTGLQFYAERDFGFLVTEKNYKCIQSAPYWVRFESPKTFIQIAFDGMRSYELTLNIGRIDSKGNKTDSFSIDEILRLRKVAQTDQLSFIQVTSRENLDIFTAKLAKMLRTYGEDFIEGNEKSFIELSEQHRKEVDAYNLDRDLRVARAEVEKAWHQKDYAAVIKAFGPFRAALTASEVGKLEFAEKENNKRRF